jgi:hypothetical protein
VILEMANKSKNANKGKNRRLATKTGMSVIPAQPPHMCIKFRYSARGTLTEAAAGTGTTYTYRINSLWDPNLTGVGAQPVGLDQWATLFERAVVLSADVRVDFVNVSASNAPCRVGFWPAIGLSSIPADNDAWPSQRNARSALMGGSGKTVTTLKAHYDIAKVMDIPRSKLIIDDGYDEDLTSGGAVSGIFQALLNIYVSGISAVASTSYQINIDYVAYMTQPQSLNTS